MPDVTKTRQQLLSELAAARKRISELETARGELEEVQEALRASQDRFRRVLENSRDIVYQLDMVEGTYDYVSPAAARILGYTAEEASSKDYSDLLDSLHPADLERFGHRNAKLMAVGPGEQRFFTIEYRLRHADGYYLWFRDNHTLIRDPEGRLRYVVGAAREITAEKEAEQLARATQGRLDRAVEEERQRLAAELHDAIGQQLVAIKVSVEKALAESVPGQSGAAGHLTGLCAEAIAEVRRICRGLYPPTLERLGLVAALRELASSHNPPPPTVSFQYALELERRRFDSHLEISLFRISQEAIANAVRHGDAGRITITLELDSDGLVLSVADDGRGFDPARTTMGLGLNRMKRRAASCGGELVIYSEPGRSVVRVGVPLHALGQ